MFKKICITDDDPILVFTLKYQISKICSDLELFQFSNGKEAFDFFSNERNLNYLPDILFLDINMPVWDAWDFLNEYEKLNIPSNTIIYILSSSINPKDLQNVKKYNFVKSFLTKPIDFDQLKSILL